MLVEKKLLSRIGVDIGGTFTDLVYLDGKTGKISVEKVPTTPSHPEGGCVTAVKTAVPEDVLESAAFFLHGTTVGLNALLERRGAKVGLLVTEGFRDVLAIGNGSRGDYDLFWTPKAPLVPRNLRLPVAGRMTASGEEIIDLKEQDICDALAIFQAKDVTSIAICFMNAYANPAHELRAEKVLRTAGYNGPLSLSHRLSREYRDFERTSTTVIDAFVRSRMAGYLDHVEQELVKNGFPGTCLITRSGGGAMPFAEAADRSFETIMSGPVGGVQGAAELAKYARLGDLITADVGGTSFDAALVINGKPSLLFQGSIDGMPLQCPWVDVRSIGAGGGSVAFVDEGGLLQVGPRSSGAEPGPASYGRGGTEPTVSDAAFHLGMLGEGLLASGLKLDAEACEAALKPLADSLSFTTQDVARGIIQIAVVKMVGAMREITTEKGLDSRELSLLTFGGAGPMLATELAREMGVAEVIIPPHAGNFSAWGLLGADLIQNASRTHVLPLTEEGLRDVAQEITILFRELSERSEYMDPETTVQEVGLDLRFKGQEHTLTIFPSCRDKQLQVPLDEITKMFKEAYGRAYGNALNLPVEIVAIRTAMRQPLPRRIENVTAGEASDRKHDPVKAWSFSRNKMMEFPVMDRTTLALGSETPGPAIILEPTTTTYVDADYTIFNDDFGCLRLRRRGDRE